jgi:hypothetical protein
MCYDFRDRRIVPTRYTLRTHAEESSHLKSLLTEILADGENWQEVDKMENSGVLNGSSFARTFAVNGVGTCIFIRLVNIGKNHRNDECLATWVKAIRESLAA